jgi:hypothetical protein
MSKIKNSAKPLSMTKNAIAKRAKKASAAPAHAAPVVAAPVVAAPVVAAPVVAAPVVAAPVKIIAGLDTVNDILVTIGNSWNAAHGEIVAKIDLRDNSFPFNRFEYAAEAFPNSKWSVLRTTDNGREVGVPFDAKSYSVFTNAKRKTFLEKLISGIEKTGIQCAVETAGTLKDRSKQFVSVRLVGLDQLQAGGRKIESFLSLLTAIDKSLSFTLVNSTLTVCCANTFEAAKNQTGAPLYAKVKMTRNADFKIDEVPLIVESFVSGNNELLAQLNQWHSIGVTNIQAETIFAAWLGTEGQPMSTRLAGIVNRLRELHATGKGNKGETALDAFEAVTEYYTHESAGETDNVLKQFESSEIGAGAQAKAEFFDYLVKTFETTATFDGICKVGENILVATRASAAAK